MRHQRYDHKTLGKFFYPSEIASLKNKIDDKENIINISINNIYKKTEDDLKIISKNKKISFCSNNISFKLLYRKITRDLLVTYGGKTPSRNNIMKSLLSILRENFPYKVFKLDITSFYESFDKEELITSINNLDKISPYSREFILFTINNCHEKAQQYYSNIPNSLPRGINFSGIIANILMREFDDTLKNNENIFYYSRFVDDIIIVSNLEIDNNELITEIKNKLYKGLKLNNKKKVIQSYNSTPSGNNTLNLDYLGYNIKFYDDENNKEKIGKTFKSKAKYQKLEVSISNKKINKIKNRISKCFIEYIKHKDSELLINRIKFLASNKYIRDKKTLKNRINGIRYNYPLLIEDKSLDKLDKFISFLLYSDKSRLSKIIKNNTPKDIKKKIKSLSFKRFYENNVFFYFSPSEIIKIQECWKHE